MQTTCAKFSLETMKENHHGDDNNNNNDNYSYHYYCYSNFMTGF